MSRHALAYVILAAFVCTAKSGPPVEVSVDGLEERWQCLERLYKAESPTGLAGYIRRHFASASAEQLDTFACSPDCSDALAAGWERVRRCIPEGKLETTISVEPQALSRFLGLVEGRIRLPIPRRWEASVRRAQANSRENVWFPVPKAEEWLSAHPKVVRRGPKQWTVEDGRHTITLPIKDPWPPVDRGGSSSCRAANLCCLDRLAARVRINCLLLRQIAAKSSRPPKSGRRADVKDRRKGWHFVDIRTRDETVAVFGISGGCAYVELFDKKTGRNQCRFSTSYFEWSDL